MLDRSSIYIDPIPPRMPVLLINSIGLMQSHSCYLVYCQLASGLSQGSVWFGGWWTGRWLWDIHSTGEVNDHSLDIFSRTLNQLSLNPNCPQTVYVLAVPPGIRSSQKFLKLIHEHWVQLIQTLFLGTQLFTIGRWMGLLYDTHIIILAGGI